MMWRAMVLVGFLSAGAISARAADASRFDGDWAVTVSCPDAAGAMGYSYQMDGKARDGVFHAERLHAGEPGWLVIDGPIAADGAASFYAKGLVGAAPFAVGARPKGTPFGYHVDARFEADKGSGRRVEGRRCDLEFQKR